MTKVEASEDLVRLPRRRVWQLLAGGLAYLVLDFAGNSTIASLSGAPTGDDPILGFFVQHDELIHLMAWCIALSGVCLAAFAVGLRLCLDRPPAADVVAAAGVMTGTVVVVSNGVLLAARAARSEEQLSLLWHLWNSGVVAAIPAGVLRWRRRRRCTGPVWTHLGFG